MEFGEHPDETAVRETREETGLEVKLDELAMVDSQTFTFEDLEMHAIMFIYRAHVTGGNLAYELDGSTDICQWFTRDEAEELPLVELAQLGVRLAFN